MGADDRTPSVGGVAGRAPRPGLRGRLALLALGLLLALVGLELSLRLAAALYAWRAGEPAAAPASAPSRDSYRVLCLGESTTAGFFATPYSTLLERELRGRYGRRFEVVNAGRPGTHSADLVAGLPALLDEHAPDMVILMMGVNDPLYFDEPARAWPSSRVQRWLYRFRSYRLLRLIRERLAAPEPVDEEHLRRFEAAAQEVAAQLVEAPRIELEGALLDLIRTAQQAPGPRTGDGVLGVPQPYLLAYQRAHEALARIYQAAGRDDDAVALLEAAVARHPDAHFFRVELARLDLELGRKAAAEVQLREARRLAEGRLLGVTRESYWRAADLLRERGIRIVAMQYPMRSVETLRQLLADVPGVVFVDNEPAFREAVTRLGYDRVFRDRFAGDFGHWGEVGNRLVVDDLIATVFDPLFAGDPAPGPPAQ